MKSSSFAIEHECPQCGAPAALEETDRLFSCEFCRVKSYLVKAGVFRYAIPAHAPPGTDLLYVPYWRFKGMCFSCVPGGIRHRFMDLSQQAVDSHHFPLSLGLRSQTLRMRFLSSATPGRFLAPRVPLEKIMDAFGERFGSSLPKPLFHRAYIGETTSLIYAPVYLRDQVYDAVLNQPATSFTLTSPEELLSLPAEAARSRIRFLPAMCPHCGWDLEGQRDSLVLGCRNCSSMWMADKQRLIRIKFGHTAHDGERTALYLPFWRIRADVENLQLKTMADLIRAANLPRVADAASGAQELRFWSMAFKIRPQEFLRPSKYLTLSQPREKLLPGFPDGRLHPVTLPVTEAVESLKLTLAGMLKPARDYWPQLAGIRFRPRSFVLVYLPFAENHLEYICPRYHLTINKNVLGLSGNL